MYVLINLEGVWEVKFELLNETVPIPPPPPPPILLIYQRASCVSVLLTRKENISLSFSAVKKSAWKASVLTAGEASEKRLADVVFVSYQYLYFNTLQLESTIALPFSHLFQIKRSSDVDVFRQTGNVK